MLIVVYSSPMDRSFQARENLTAAIHAQMPVARNPHGSIKVEEHVHERIVIWNFNDRPVRKGLFDGALEDSPGPVAMEIINQQNPAAQAILSQASGFVGRRTPVALARLLQEYKRIFKNLIVAQLQVPFFIRNLEVRRAP